MVAIKVMNPELAATSPPRKRFLREARSSAAVKHENIVSIYAVEEQPIPYLVMEYVPGMTLQQWLDQHGPLNVTDVLRIGQQIATGLAAAHAQGLIHRDIKPANILLENGLEQRVKISDFGLARAADDATLTQSGLIAGTPMYMAPEQARGEPLDPRADLFSLGSVLYVMTSGRPPFRAPSTLAVLKRVCEDTPRSIGEIMPGTPQWLCDIIARLHAKEPDERFQTAKDVADVLGQHLAYLREPHVAPKPQPVEPVRAAAGGDVLRQLRGPAMGLIATACVNWITLIVLLFVTIAIAAASRGGFSLGAAEIILLPVLVLGSGLILAGGLRMQRVESHGFCVFASIAAMLIGPGYFLGWPVGIWSLIVLSRPEVRAAFRQRERRTVERSVPATGIRRSAWLTAAAAIVLLAIGLWLGPWLPLWLRGEAVVELNLEDRNARLVLSHSGEQFGAQFGERHGDQIMPVLPGLYELDLIPEAGREIETAWLLRQTPLGTHQQRNLTFPMLLRIGRGDRLKLSATFRNVAMPPLLPASPATATQPQVDLLQSAEIERFVQAKSGIERRDGVLILSAPGVHNLAQLWIDALSLRNARMRVVVEAADHQRQGVIQLGWEHRGGDPRRLDAVLNTPDDRKPAAMFWRYDASFKLSELSERRLDVDYTKPIVIESELREGGVVAQINGVRIEAPQGLDASRPVRPFLGGMNGVWKVLEWQVQDLDAPAAPPLAIAPFDAAQARQHQEVWAQHLGVPVEFTDQFGLTFRLIPPGEFQMGSTAVEIATLSRTLEQAEAGEYEKFVARYSGPQHKVRITQPFYCSAYEVTAGQYRRFIEETKYMGTMEQLNVKRFHWSDFAPELDGGRRAVIGVSWDDANAFCQWLSRKTGLTVELPTEAQWEFACRAGTTTLWSFGNDQSLLNEYAVYGREPSQPVETVGSRKPNPFGLYDLHGNAEEWCRDWHDSNFYAQSPVDDPVMLANPAERNSGRVLRGGSSHAAAWWTRSTTRAWDFPATPANAKGFRVVITRKLANVAPKPSVEAAAHEDVPASAAAPANVAP